MIWKILVKDEKKIVARGEVRFEEYSLNPWENFSIIMDKTKVVPIMEVDFHKIVRDSISKIKEKTEESSEIDEISFFLVTTLPNKFGSL